MELFIKYQVVVFCSFVRQITTIMRCATTHLLLPQVSHCLFVAVAQIPSDLISFDPANSASGAEASVVEKLEAVKGHVKQIEGMVRSQLRGLSTALQRNICGVYAFVFFILVIVFKPRISFAAATTS